MIYLNNAATSYPKPDIVKKTFMDALDELPPGQFRSATAGDGSDVFSVCRQRLGALMGIAETHRIFFTSGSTESLNTIFYGLGVRADEIITTVTEHNSVLRPLCNLSGIKGKPIFLTCDKNGTIDPGLFEAEAKKGRAKAIVLNHCSNVTGAIQDAGAVGEIAKKYGLVYILDVSQSAGCIDIRADEWNVDALAFTGHKSLMGLQGTGGYYVRKGLTFLPMKYGGTGLDSRRIVYEDGEYEYETGTQNSTGVAALSAALGWINDLGTDAIAHKEKDLSDQLIEGMSDIKSIHIFGRELKERGPVVSFDMEGLLPSDLAYILQNSFDIVTRAGLHCAPLIHEHIGSGERGTLRVSFSYLNKATEIEELLTALKETEAAVRQ